MDRQIFRFGIAWHGYLNATIDAKLNDLGLNNTAKKEILRNNFHRIVNLLIQDVQSIC